MLGNGYKQKLFGICSFCEKVHRSEELSETRDDKIICQACAVLKGFCEICGSWRLPNQTPDEQLHYDELCFK